MPSRWHLAAASAGLFTVLAACSTTVDDSRELAIDTVPLEAGTIVDDDTPQTTIAVVGSAADLLPEIGIDMSRLSAEIGDEGDEDATLMRIEANWEAIRAEIERDRPELLNGIQTTVDMARTAVETNRPADADKAFGLLTDLIDSFTGDR